jgi:hypothetical protein
MDSQAPPLARARAPDDAGAFGDSEPGYAAGDSVYDDRKGGALPPGPEPAHRRQGGLGRTPCGARSARATFSRG